jgi:hypothetical protein
VSPKVGAIVGPWGGTELYVNAGTGFHSNDARGAAISVDPTSGEPVDRVTPLVRAKGAEIGVRTVRIPGLQSTVALWYLGIDSEQLFVMALLVTDVTLTKADEQITMGVRFRGGATTTVSVPAPLTPWRKRQTHPRALARAKDLLETHTHAHVAEQLNAEGFITGAGAPFDAAAIGWLARRWDLTTYRRHLQAAGYLTTRALAHSLASVTAK